MNKFIIILFCGYFCELSSINLRNLKSASCEITYKAIYDDLMDKEKMHRMGRYNMPSAVRRSYEQTVRQWLKACVPEDMVLDKIERNQAPVDLNYL